MSSRKTATQPTAEPPGPESKDDLVLVHGRTEDGKGLKVLRKRADQLSMGEVRPLEEGKPIAGDVVSLRPRPEMPLLCDVEVHAEVPTSKPSATRSAEAAPDGAGPARVSTDAYRVGWDRMWGRRRRKELN